MIYLYIALICIMAISLFALGVWTGKTRERARIIHVLEQTEQEVIPGGSTYHGR